MSATELEAAVLEALRAVQDPEVPRDIVSLGMVQGVECRGGAATVSIRLTTPACPLRESIERDVKAAAGKVRGVSSVEVRFGAEVVRRAGPLPATRVSGRTYSSLHWKITLSPFETVISLPLFQTWMSPSV